MSSKYKKEAWKFKRPSLLEDIKSILHQYSDDGQIFKEIIQNAEDAGASEVVFVFDKNNDSHRDIKLSNENLRIHQGPSLYAYNDAKFQELDWDGITSLRKSNKAKDPLKVGRFGLGFKSVFHLSDMPCVSSGSRFAYFDPLETTLGVEIEVLVLDKPEDESKTCDDFYKLERLPAPYWDKKNNCSGGTIFQFPLRLKASDLSSVCYSIGRMSNLLEKFMKEAVLTLVFLKHIKSIKIFVIEDGANEIKEIYSCKLSDETRIKYDTCKESFVYSMVSSAKKKDFETPQCCNHILEIIENSESSKSSAHNYAVSEYFGYNGSNEKFSNMMQNEELSYLPLIGVAYPLIADDNEGHVFSCLPLPLQSKCMNGMPVHVNGYFALGQDRKDLKWKTLSTEESNDITVDWNFNLIFELLPIVYCNLIQYLIQEGYGEDTVYRAWPSREKTNNKWAFFLQEFYQKVRFLNCIYVNLNGGLWEIPQNIYYLYEEQFERNDRLQVVEEFLLTADKKIARVPSHIFKNLELKQVDKQLVQDVCREKSKLYKNLQPSSQSHICSFMIQSADDVKRLKQLELFPLMNGRYMAVETQIKSNIYLIPTDEHPANVLSSNDRVLDLTYFADNEALLRRLKSLSLNGQINMKLLQSSKDVLNDLRSFFKSHLCTGDICGVRWPFSNIPRSWLQNLLDYRRMYRIPFTDLSGIPFILIQNYGTQFLSVSTNKRKPLLVSHGYQNMSSNMQSFLHSCGVWFLNSTVETQDINDFFNAGLVLAPNQRNILEVLSSCKKDHIRKNFDNADETLRIEFQDIIKSCRKQKLPNFCFELPLFKIFGHSDKYVTARNCKVVAASDLPEEWKSSFTDVVTLESVGEQLMVALQMKQWSFRKIAEVMIENIEKLCIQQQVSFFSFFLNKIKNCNQDPSFCKKIKNKVKICDQKNNVKRPMDLFEETEELRSLFHSQNDYFPATAYNTTTLKMFGLKSKKDVSLEEINVCITNISNAGKDKAIWKDFENKYLKKIKVIFTVLIENRINVDYLPDLPWIPVSDEPPRNYPNALKWHGQRRKELEPLQKPSEVYPQKYQLHVGSSVSVCHHSIAQSFELCFEKHPHVKHIPHMEVLLSHLKNIEASYDENERGSFNQLVYAVYQYLNHYERELVKVAKEKGMLIWQGRKFVPINQIILSKPHCGSLEPYFYHPPKEVIDLIGNFLKEFGCEKNEFNLYVQTLQEIAKKNDINYDYTADMRLVFLIVKELARSHSKDCIKNKCDVFVPVENLRLKLERLSECFYHKFNEGTPFSSKNSVLHHDLGEGIAIQLEVPTLVSKVLTGNKLNIFKPWGQTEPLTRRLQKLLDDYQDGLAIVKEMIQNADDAGATKVKFLYDKRQNKTLNMRLFDPSMKYWQGPALFVFNNAIFSEDDFHNITRISGATKEQDTTKIGKFGLGFNSVYHLTDVPSFLSDTSIVFFDPHEVYMESVLKNQRLPGIRVSMGDSWKDMGDFSDQFLVFQDIFDVNFDFSKESFESYNGTLFRLPLRTEETARKSEIKKKPYSNNEMMKLLEKMETYLDTLLLFSENVSSVEVYTLESMAQSPKEMQLLFSAHKSTTKKGKGVMQLADQELRSLKSYSNYKVPSKELNSQPEIIFKTQITTTNTKKEKTTSSWIVSSCVGSQRTFQFAAEHNGLVPCGGVAIEVGRSKDTVSPLKSGQFFCFLPLPIDSLLPVHVNGAFEIERNRKAFKKYNRDEKDFGKMEWNILLAEDLSEAYYNLISHLQTNFKLSLETLFACLPGEESKNDLVSDALTKITIKKIINGNVPLFPIKNKRIFWHQIKILNVSEEISVAAHILMNLWYQFRREEYYCLEIPHSFLTLVNSCQTGWASEKAIIKEKNVLLKFLQSISEIALPAEKQHCLINYILEKRMNSKGIGCDLTNTMWVPTSPNGKLKKPCDLVKRNSKAGELFTEKEEVFPLVKDRHLSYLEKLGMHSDYIPWLMILDRAQSIEKLELSDFKTATERSEKLLFFIKNAKVSCPPNVLNELQKKRFLQVLQRPNQCVFKEWYGSKYSFSSPDLMYSRKYCNLVCTSQLVCEGNAPEEQLQINDKLPNFDVIRYQLNDLISSNNENSTSCAHILDEIYEFLNKNFKILSSQEKEELSKMEFIQTKEGNLTSSSKVYVNAPCALSDYIYTLRSENLHCFSLKKFFQMIGVKDECKFEDYAKAIQEMKDVYKDEPISNKHLEEICHLVSHLCKKENEMNDRAELYLPDVKGILRKESELCYKDFVTNECLEDEVYISDDLSIHCIKALKIKASSTVKFQRKADQVDNLWISFGQTEELTTRIKNILGGYSDSIDIFKEMFQNADDSKASELTFILDKRQHGQKDVFNENWKDLQGPALLVCNNGVFKEEDLISIQNLGDANKKRDPLTTGKYGVGFNVVYSVTDCPALLANVNNTDMFCIFDPHLRYAEGATIKKPGSMVKDARNFLNSYSDVKSSFLLDTKYETTNKTVFRLPLRNDKTAKISEICPNAITEVEDIEKKFTLIMKRASEFLLFLLHLKTITFSVINTNGEIKTNKFQAKTYDVSGKRLKEFRQFQINYAQKLGNVASLMNSERRLARSVCVQHFENDEIFDVWHWDVVEQCGFSDMTSVDKDVIKLIDENKLHQIPKGGIAKLSKETCCLYCENIDVQKRSTNSGSYVKRNNVPKDTNVIFCTLPLDVKTGIPVIINGNFVLNYETRRDIIKSTESIGFKWNQSIMISCVVPCYIQFVEERAKELNGKYDIEPITSENTPSQSASNRNGSCDISRAKENDMIKEAEKKARKKHNKDIESYYSVFPEYSKAQDEYGCLVKEFYECISKKALLVVHRSREIAFCNARDDFLHFNLLSENVSEERLLKILKSAYLDTDVIPDHVSASFKEAGLSLTTISPSEVRARLKNVSDKILPNKASRELKKTVFMNVPNVREVLNYIMNDKESVSLEDLPLCVTAFEKLEKFCKQSPKYLFYFSNLFEGEKKNFFLHKSLINSIEIANKYYNFENGILLRFTMSVLSEFLEDTLPKDKLKSKEKPIKKEDIHDFNEEWISEFWSSVLSILNKEEEENERFLENKKLAKKDNQNVDDVINHENALLGTRPTNERKQNQLPLTSKLQEIEDWSLVLAKRGDTKYLLPISKSKLVIKMKKSGKIQQILKEKLGIFEPMLEIKKDLLFSYIKKIKNVYRIDMLFGSMESYEEIIDACLFADKNDFIGSLVVDDAKEILQLIQGMLSEEITESLKRKILQLPLFERCDGTLCNGTGNVVVHPQEIPLNGILGLESLCNVKILKHMESLKKLFDTLRLKPTDGTDYYIQYVLKHFDELEDKDAFTHLEYLRTMSVKLRGDEKESFFKILKKFKLLPCRTGRRRVCCEMYKSNIEIFKLMQHDGDFLQNADMELKPFWVIFLEELGFHNTLDKDLIIRYAKEMENEVDLGKLFRVSELLCKEIFSYADEFWKDTIFLSTLSHIKFLPSLVNVNKEEDLELVYPSRNSEVSRMSYSEGVNPLQSLLVWTTECILPPHAVDHNIIWDQVEYLKIPSVTNESVINHFKKILNKEENFRRKTDTCKGINKDFKEIYHKSLKKFYEYLKNNRTIDPSVMQDISFVLVNNSEDVDIPRKSILPGQQTIPPFLNSIDERLGYYFDVFEELKCYRTSEVFHYANVLKDLYEKSKGATLEPNYLSAAEKATCRLSEVLKGRGYQYSGQLYLPTTTLKDKKAKLTLSRDCIYLDDFSNEKRLEAFKGPILPLKYRKEREERGDKIVNEMLVKYLPRDIAPKRIGECVKEVLGTPKQKVEASIGHPGVKLKRKMQHPLFLESFKRLLSHEHDLSESVSKFIEAIFKKVEITVLTSLKTHFLFKGEKVAASEEVKDFFMEVDDNQLHLYFAAHVSDNEIMYKRFSEMILKKIDHPTDGKVSMLFPGLLEKNTTELSKYLDKCGIKRDISSARQSIVPEIGERVREEHINLLRQDATDFSAGEWIAVDMSGEEDYVYAKIIKIVSEDQPGERVYEVQISEEGETEEIHELNLYKFDQGYELEEADENNDDERQIVLMGDNNDSDPLDDFTQECLGKGYEEITNEIRKILQNLVGKPDDVRKRTIRRLYLTWHPDKHHEKTKELATRVFQFLQNELNKSPQNDQFKDYHAKWSRTARERWEYSHQFYHNFRRQRRSHSSFFNTDRRNSNNNSRFFTSAPPCYENTNPQPAEARRWMKQALCDLQTAVQNLENNRNSYEWICYISHQAAEKAIKSAIFLTDYKDLGNTHNLVTLTTKYLSGDGELKVKSEDLEKLVILTKKTKYPNLWRVPKIPNSSYTQQQASDAIDLARSIIEHIQEKYDAEE